MDTIALVDDYPEEDGRCPAHEIVRSGGGPAAVAAITLARLGIHTGIMGTVGDDDEGRQILHIFEQEGVDAQVVSISSAPTAGSVIVASRKRMTRAISTRQPPNQPAPSALAHTIARQAQWIHCDHVGITQLERLGISRGSGPKISFDAGYGAESFDASLVDLFVPTDRQISLRHPGIPLAEAVVRDASTSNNTVVATRGDAGCAGFTAETGYLEVSGFPIDVVSTLGAGDVFHGALLAQLAEERNFESSLQRANAVAALSCRGLDAISMIPSSKELEQFMEEQK